MRLIVNRCYKYREIAGEYYLIPVGEAARSRKTPLQLTETAAWIWTAAEAGKSREEIRAEMTEEFDVDPAAARGAVDAFLDSLVREGLLEAAAE